jgi:hypothetical protein
MSIQDRESSGLYLTVELEQTEKGASVQLHEALHLASLHPCILASLHATVALILLNSWDS